MCGGKVCGDRGQVTNQPVGLDVPYACAQMEEIYLQSKITRKGIMYRCADKSLTRPTSRCIFIDGENISFDATLVLYI